MLMDQLSNANELTRTKNNAPGPSGCFPNLLPKTQTSFLFYSLTHSLPFFLKPKTVSPFLLCSCCTRTKETKKNLAPFSFYSCKRKLTNLFSPPFLLPDFANPNHRFILALLQPSQDLYSGASRDCLGTQHVESCEVGCCTIMASNRPAGRGLLEVKTLS